MSSKAKAFDLASCPIESGLTLVEASAGTGKTYSLAGMILRLLLEGHASGIGNILVMTFTNAATAELVERIRELVRDAAMAFESGGSDDAFLASLVTRHRKTGLAVMRTALRDLDDIEVSTIHGFCRRVLEQNALEVGVPFEMDYVENDRALLARAAESFWRETVYPTGRLAARVLADEEIEPTTWLKAYDRAHRHPHIRIAPDPVTLDAAIAGLESAGEAGGDEIDAFVHALRARFLHDVELLVEREKRVASTAGYDDLLRRLHARLGDKAATTALRRALATQFEAVLVDEFQDTDEVQLEIFDGLFAETKLFYVGDPKQAIYSFRGADVFAYLRAKRRAEHVYTMTQNWRSETPLVAAINMLHERSPAPFVLGEIPFVPVSAAGKADAEALTGDGRAPLEWIRLATDGNKETGRGVARDAVVRECVRLLDPANGARLKGVPVEPRNIAVLVRYNRDATAVQAALVRAGVPAVVSQAGSVFESEEAAELDILLRAVLEPRRSGAVRAALATCCFGRDAAAIAEVAEDEARWQELGEKLDEARTTWMARGFAAMASRLLDISCARANLLALEDGERRLTNLLHLIELGQQAIGELCLSPDGLVAWLAERIKEKDRSEEVAELRLESDADAVQIVTIHKSKGLEYDIVFVPFAWDTKSPTDSDADGALVHVSGETVLHFGTLPQEIDSACKAEMASEDARLAYVALTRAKHRCYVVWGTLGGEASCNSALARIVDPSLPVSVKERDALRKQLGREALDKRFRAALDALCKSSNGTMAVRDHDASASRERWQRPQRLGLELEVRAFPDAALPQLEPWRLASFSSLVAARAAPGVRTIAERPDYVDPEGEPLAADATATGMFAFARGAQAGTCLHEIFETIDFTRAESDELEKIVAATLARHDLADPKAHRGDIDPVRDVSAAVRAALSATLPGERFALASVTRARKLSEWQFYLPMAAVSAARFADVLAKHNAKLATPAYFRSLHALGDRRVEGFLTGFVDLVFEHDGRFGIVDWKSNHLGNDARAYDERAIARSMREHHYVLQYHLYVLALHRYLRQRVRDYDYDRHVGGVYYAYLRGIRPGKNKSSPTGWFHDRPSRALVEALDELVGGAAK